MTGDIGKIADGLYGQVDNTGQGIMYAAGGWALGDVFVTPYRKLAQWSFGSKTDGGEIPSLKGYFATAINDGLPGMGANAVLNWTFGGRASDYIGKTQTLPIRRIHMAVDATLQQQYKGRPVTTEQYNQALAAIFTNMKTNGDGLKNEKGHTVDIDDMQQKLSLTPINAAALKSWAAEQKLETQDYGQMLNAYIQKAQRNVVLVDDKGFMTDQAAYIQTLNAKAKESPATGPGKSDGEGDFVKDYVTSGKGLSIVGIAVAAVGGVLVGWPLLVAGAGIAGIGYFGNDVIAAFAKQESPKTMDTRAEVRNTSTETQGDKVSMETIGHLRPALTVAQQAPAAVGRSG